LNQSPIPRVLLTFLKNKVKALLIGGQACIIYGGAEFSRDLDFSLLVTLENIENLKNALEELEAEQIFLPNLSEEVLIRGHACHFRFPKGDPKGVRIDLLGKMREVDDFNFLWHRRKEIEISGLGTVAVISLPDLVKSKKTQRDKDWPMIRRLIEADIYNAPADPPEEQIIFWLSECRTPELLIALVKKYSEPAKRESLQRPLLIQAISGCETEIEKLLHEEEEYERKLDKEYWAPLKKELEIWRHKK
jgi:hypothetical protein